MEKQEKVFASGLFFDRPRENSPEWIKGRMSIKVPEAIIFLQKYQNNAGYVNLDLKASKEGKLYLELNTFVPKSSPSAPEQEKIQERLIDPADGRDITPSDSDLF